MAAIFAPHLVTDLSGYVADRYGNDPFVWSSPFLWSHCHARSRKSDFGTGSAGPQVFGRDVVFFVTAGKDASETAIDCVFVVAEIRPIRVAEAADPVSHPARHDHFDQDRNPFHRESTVTRIADFRLSFVSHPPMPLASWVEGHVHPTGTMVLDDFRDKRRKNVRVIVNDAQGIHDRVVAWCEAPGHAALAVLPMRSLEPVPLDDPGSEPIDWVAVNPDHPGGGGRLFV